MNRLLACRPKTFAEHRLQVLVYLLLDAGLRISEALSVRREDLDLDNMLITVRGKGGKYRALPFLSRCARRCFAGLSGIRFRSYFDLWCTQGTNLPADCCCVLIGGGGSAISYRWMIRHLTACCAGKGTCAPSR